MLMNKYTVVGAIHELPANQEKGTIRELSLLCNFNISILLQITNEV